MATKTRTVTQTYAVDDVTGQESKSLAAVDVKVGDETGRLELTERSRKALVDLIHGDDTSWRKLFEVKPGGQPTTSATASAPEPTRTRKRGTGGESSQAYAWAETPEGQAEVKRLDIEYTKHGQAPKALKDAWREATGHALAA